MNDMPYHLLFQDRVERGTSTNSPLFPPPPPPTQSWPCSTLYGTGCFGTWQIDSRQIYLRKTLWHRGKLAIAKTLTLLRYLVLHHHHNNKLSANFCVTLGKEGWTSWFVFCTKMAITGSQNRWHFPLWLISSTITRQDRWHLTIRSWM